MENFIETNESESQESPPEARGQNESLIDVIVATTKVEVLLDLVQKINFETLTRIIKETPAEHTSSQNYRVLNAVLNFKEDLDDIFINDPENKFNF